MAGSSTGSDVVVPAGEKRDAKGAQWYLFFFFFFFRNSSVRSCLPDYMIKVRWHRSTFYNMTVLGLCNLAAPGIWGGTSSATKHPTSHNYG